jgi:hypothetical protein
MKAAAARGRARRAIHSAAQTVVSCNEKDWLIFGFPLRSRLDAYTVFASRRNVPGA